VQVELAVSFLGLSSLLFEGLNCWHSYFSSRPARSDVRRFYQLGTTGIIGLSNIDSVSFQPGHLAIPDSYTRSPDLLPHRTDLTIQDVVRPFLYLKFICHCSVVGKSVLAVE